MIRRGQKTVARLVPIRGGSSPESRRQAIAEMRQLAAKTQLAGVSVKELIAEGRR